MAMERDPANPRLFYRTKEYGTWSNWKVVTATNAT